MKTIKLAGHQGDVCIFEVDELPTDLVQDAQAKNAILAYGELSGHAHQFEDMATVRVSKSTNPKYEGLCFVEPLKDAKLVHGKARDFFGREADHDYHNPVILKEGKKYMTGIVEETDWITKTIRRVID
jgi:hypothetical protein